MGPGRSATTCTSCRWTRSDEANVRVPYRLSNDYSENEKIFIRAALQEISTLTCVHLVERSTEEDFLDIGSGSGCWSHVGKVGGAQYLSLMKTGCLSRGVIQHEVQHALGFYHEQSRSDRDDFIDVMWQYIDESDWSNFEMVDTDNLDEPYDYSSVLHYGWYAFSNTSGQLSLKPKPDPTVSIGQRYGLSQEDVTKVKKLYGCRLCSFLLTGLNGFLDSRSYMSEYSKEKTCLWLIRVNTNKALMHIQSFNVSPSSDCSSNYITVYDGANTSSPLLIDKACGRREFPLLVASTGAMLLEFVHDENSTSLDTEFQVAYSSVDCGGTHLEDHGTVTSPGYPNVYPNMANCITTIWAPPGYQIVLDFTALDVEYSASCLYDYLIINDGGSPGSPELGRFCSDMKIPTLMSTGNILLLQFNSDVWMNKSGYSADYYFVKPE
ncbi:hypothetical protein GDO86_019341 [Hymenochirus boettgeri]|uniref:Metalloendopeptidase n=1 Tax=Hymenochirus boettgeri TaxID=247094 RepID=A0A8T2IHL4_9PIPI|nr:hypothetical protein GDO86_019341 [Hymenochirus boettgeri]